MSEVYLGSNLQENVSYTDESGLPLKAGVCSLSCFPNMTGTCHWHKELELIYVLEGHMEYYVEGKTYPLAQGSGIFVNAGRLHYAIPVNRAECNFDLLLFNPSLLTGNQVIYSKYVKPLLRDAGSSAVLLGGSGWTGDLCAQAHSLAALCREQPAGYELRLQSLLPAFWLTLYENTVAINGSHAVPVPGVASMKSMIEYIHTHYAEHILLDDIAAAGIMSRTKCCGLFRKNVNQTPMEFLNNYRIHKSTELLTDRARTISDIAQDCGFSGSSYFAETFRKVTGLSPTAYRGSVA